MDRRRSVLHILIHFLLHEPHRPPAERARQQSRVRFLCSRRAERVHRRFAVQGAVVFAGAELHRDRSFCCPASGKAGGKPTAMCGDSEWRQTPPQQSSAGGCLLPRGFGRYRSKSIVNLRAKPQVFLAAQNAKAGGQRRGWFVTVTANEDCVGVLLSSEGFPPAEGRRVPTEGRKMTKCLVLVCLLLGTAGASSAQQGGRADCSAVTQDGNLPPATQLTDTNAAAPENAKLTAGSFSRPSPATTSSAPSAPVPEPEPRPKFVYGSRDDYRWQLGFGVAVMRFRSAQFYATGVGTNTSLVYFTNEWLW